MENENRTPNDVKFRELLQKSISHRVSSVGRDLMEFRENFQNSAQGIIDNLSQILNSVEEEFLQDLRQELSVMESSVRRNLEPELRTELESDLRRRMETEFEERLKAAQQSEIAASTRGIDSKIETLDASLRQISQLNNQVDILSCYLDKAALFASRVALFVVKSGNLVGWQARGFERDFNSASIKTLVFSADSENFLRKVAATGVAYHGESGGHSDVLPVVQKLGPGAPERICAIPLIVREKTVAVLYTDSGIARNVALDAHSLEILTTVVSLTVELSSARTRLGMKPLEAGTAVRLEPSQVAEPAAVPVTPVEAKSTEIPPAVVSPEEIQPQSHPAASAPQPAPEPEKPSLIPSAPPAVEVAPAVETPVAAVPPAPSPKPAAPADIDEADQKLHNDARRFARLLVSEIKLYNEQKVQTGRREKNLYGLLRDDIDKSREMYDKRVAPKVAAQVDYFYDELVRILADNQVGSLGADCPGPALLSR